jgi:hypothetical protein
VEVKGDDARPLKIGSDIGDHYESFPVFGYVIENEL